jgi:hypothetical protein
VDGYVSLLEAIRSSENPQHEDALDWVGEGFDPEVFDLESVNRKLRHWSGRTRK